MEEYNSIIIGFGKGGKTLAGELANHGEKVAMIEKSDNMYGGTCINVGCIPTKYLLTKGSNLQNKEIKSFEDYKEEYTKIIQNKKEFISKLRTKNFNMLNNNEMVTVYTGEASFVSEKEVKIQMRGESKVITAEKIFINTGSKTIIPKIEGVNLEKVYTSTSMMELEELPKRLVVIGGGYIGLEYSYMYTNFGSQVTVLEYADRLLPKEDEDVANSVQEVLEAKGITFELNSQVQKIQQIGEQVLISYLQNGKEEKLEADGILLATGRKANTEELQLANAGIETNARGEIIVNEKLQTNKENIWAIGDVKGGLQFTYISLDDYRIIKSQLYGKGEYTLEKRKLVPYSMFIEPHLARIGFNQTEAMEQGYEIKVAKMMAAESPRANILGMPKGILKAIVDRKTNKILGVTLFCPMAAEMINIIRIAMVADLDYTVLRDNIYTHPTMSESFNELFSRI